MTDARAADHAKRIERAIAFIDSRLDGDIRLDDLAAAACLSPFHFHRLYRMATGETPADTLRRRRLQRAAGELSLGKMPIAKIARRAGYGSLAAFGRAFAAAFGVPPAAYRKRGHPTSPVSPNPNAEEHSMYAVEIRDLPAHRVAGIRHNGPYQEIAGTFERLMVRAGALGLMGPETLTAGVYYDDPGTVPAKDLRSDACIVVPGGFAGTDDLRVFDLAAGRHAVLRFQGPYAELEKPYNWLYRDWLPRSGEIAADRPPFEFYLNDCRALPPTEWLTDICLPLAAK
ncbi:MAG: AraC family transcriptional regulator [Tagaea sp.]|nr:AraC family transcriptional regulator [Tagaea sp.]